MLVRKKILLLFITTIVFNLFSYSYASFNTDNNRNENSHIVLPAIISDGMVLQQKSKAPIWGWAQPGQKIIVRGDWSGNKIARTTTNDNGKWQVKVKTPSAGGPYTVTIKGKRKIVIHNVMIGEVWLCSGQSNMAMPMKGFPKAPILHSKQAIDQAHYSDIRLFKVKRHIAYTPQKKMDGTWSLTTPETIANFSATAYFFGLQLYKELGVPIGLINSSWGGTPVEAWTSKDALKRISVFDILLNRKPTSPKKNAPGVLYNGMIAPLIPFSIRGAIWYQGAANVGRAKQYKKLFPTLIQDWRSKWKEDFPFYFVQIAPFHYGKNGRGDGTAGAALRDAQRDALSLSHTGMVVTLDIGNVNNIHPANKKDIGRRLSLWALSNIYDIKDIVYSGPLYKNVRFQGNKAILSFLHVDGGLVSKGKLNGFEIAGKNGVFVSAEAMLKGKHVIVYSEKIIHPVAVRYAWKDTSEATLFNEAGLPAPTFSTID